MTTLYRIIMLVSLALCAVACIGAEPERAAALEQKIQFCDTPPGDWYIAAPATSTLGVVRAQELVDKLFTTFPWRGTCTGNGCSWSPTTCTMAQCDAGQCPGWTCHQYGLMTADDGRVGATVTDDTGIDSRFALEPGNKLDSAETDELTAFRAAAAEFTDVSCWGF